MIDETTKQNIRFYDTEADIYDESRYTGTKGQDSIWLYLRSFDLFKKIEPRPQQVLVPGTALSYEASRGVIPLDKFRFSTSQPSSKATDPGGVGECARHHLGVSRSISCQLASAGILPV